MSQETPGEKSVTPPHIFDEAVNRPDPSDTQPRPHTLLYSPEFHPFPDKPDLGFTAVIDLTAARLEARQAMRFLHPGIDERSVRAHTPSVHRRVQTRRGVEVIKGIELSVVHPPEVSDGRYNSDHAMKVASTDADGWWNMQHGHTLVPGHNSGHVLAMMNEPRLEKISLDPHDPLPERRARFEAEANKRLVEGIHYGVVHHEGNRGLKERNRKLLPTATALLLGTSAAMAFAAEKANDGSLSVKQAAAAGVIATAGMIMGANRVMGGKFLGTKKVRRAFRNEMTGGQVAYANTGRRDSAKKTVAAADKVQLIQLVPTNKDDYERVGYTGPEVPTDAVPPPPRNVHSMRRRRENIRTLVPASLVGTMLLGTVLIPSYLVETVGKGSHHKSAGTEPEYAGPPPVFGASPMPTQETIPEHASSAPVETLPNPGGVAVDSAESDCSPSEAAAADALQTDAAADKDSGFSNAVIGYAKDKAGIAAVPKRYSGTDPACFESIPEAIPADTQYRSIQLDFDETGVARVSLGPGAEHFRAYHFGGDPLRAERVGSQLRFFGAPGVSESVIIRATA